MRITAANHFDQTVNTLQRRQQALDEAQQRLTSGKRVQRASDDPTAAAAAERALARIERHTAGQRAVDASRNAVTLSESALGDAGELLQQARETLVAAGNAAYGDGERAIVAGKLAQIRAQLLQVANRGDGAGGYLFGGRDATQPPFVDAAGGVAFRGSPGALAAPTDEAMPLTVDGEPAWMRAASGNGVFETRVVASTGAWIDSGRVTDPAQLTGALYEVQFAVVAGSTTYSVTRNGAPTPLAAVPYVSGQAIEIDGMSFAVHGTPANADRFEAAPSTRSLSIFDTLDQAIAELKTPSRTGAQVAQTTARALRDVDGSFNALNAQRAELGETLLRADGLEERMAEGKLAAQGERSRAEDLDLLGAISDFQNQQTGYDAALKTYASVQRLSLFQYLQG